MKFKYLISILLIALLSGSLEAATKSKKATTNSSQLKSCSKPWIDNNCDAKPKGTKGHDACYTNWDTCLKNNIDILDRSNATCEDKMNKLATLLS